MLVNWFRAASLLNGESHRLGPIPGTPLKTHTHTHTCRSSHMHTYQHTHTQSPAWECREKVLNIHFLHQYEIRVIQQCPTHQFMYTGPGSLGGQWVGERECRLPANQGPSVEAGARLPSLHSRPLLNLFINMFMFTACQTSPCSWQGSAGSVPSLGQQEQVCWPLHTILAPQGSRC